MKKFLLFSMFFGIILVLLLIFQKNNVLINPHFEVVDMKTPNEVVEPTPQPSYDPTPTPTPRPLTFAEMNEKYGPCIYLPVLMYHHVQTKEIAETKKQTGLTVYTNIFDEQMKYLKDKGYEIILPQDIINFFDSGAAIPSKRVMLTFDDGYGDFYSDAMPILSKYGYKGVVFTPTGLLNNFGYLSWQEISDAAGRGNYFANHTWSHKNSKQPESVLQKEIGLADTQLKEKGLNTSLVFAYPYGPSSASGIKVLESLGYKLAFTTNPGSILCKQMRFALPRIRIGNRPMASYGF